jgi:hypothetical protein
MAKMAKKILGLCMFLWVLIIIVFLFVTGIVKVGISEGFAGRKPCEDNVRSTNTDLTNQKKCLENRKCKWISGACKCCP